MTTNVTTSPALTDGEALTELERLLVLRLTDAMKEPAPAASAMAVAERFLSARKGKMAPRPLSAARHDLVGKVPFPVPREIEDAKKLQEALAIPFRAAGEPKTR